MHCLVRESNGKMKTVVIDTVSFALAVDLCKVFYNGLAIGFRCIPPTDALPIGTVTSSDLFWSK